MYINKPFLTDSDLVHIVLDIGTKYTKFGRSSDMVPLPLLKTSEIIDGEEVFLRDLRDEEKIKMFLRIFLTRVYDLLLICETNQAPLVFIESSEFCQIPLFPQIIDQVLYEYLEVPQILRLSTELAAVVALGLDTGLVVDCGQTETRVTPVYKMHCIPNASQYYNIGSDIIENRLKVALPELEEYSKYFENDICEDIKVKCCYIAPTIDSDAIGDIVHFLGLRYSITIPSDVRHSLCECLFNRQCGEERTVPSMVLDAILASPIDTRKQLASRIVIIGGTSMIPGYKCRLHNELNNLLDSSPYKNKISGDLKCEIVNSEFKENCIPWTGGAIVGKLRVMLDEYVSKAEYLKNKAVDVEGSIEQLKSVKV